MSKYFRFTPTVLECLLKEQLFNLYTQSTGSSPPSRYTKAQIIDYLADRPIRITPDQFAIFLQGAYVQTQNGRFIIRTLEDLSHLSTNTLITGYINKDRRRVNAPASLPCQIRDVVTPVVPAAAAAAPAVTRRSGTRSAESYIEQLYGYILIWNTDIELIKDRFYYSENKIDYVLGSINEYYFSTARWGNTKKRAEDDLSEIRQLQKQFSSFHDEYNYFVIDSYNKLRNLTINEGEAIRKRISDWLNNNKILMQKYLNDSARLRRATDEILQEFKLREYSV
jgi:hypothetical protein